MSSKEQAHSNDKAIGKRRISQQKAQSIKIADQQIDPATAVQQARLAPRLLSAHDVLQLQRAIGNKTVGKILVRTVHRQPVYAKKTVNEGMLIQRMTEEEAKQFVEGKGIKNYKIIECDVGEGNCHGYTFYNDDTRNESMTWMSTIVEVYEREIKGQEITVFMEDKTTVAHTAKGHGDNCVHKMGESGPIIGCSASDYAKAFGYDPIYKFPSDLAAFKELASEDLASKKSEADNEEIQNVFLHKCHKFKGEEHEGDIRYEAYWAIVNENPSDQTTKLIEEWDGKIRAEVSEW